MDEAQGYEKDQVVKIINSVLEKVDQSKNQQPVQEIYQELQELYKIIEDARNDIGSTNATEINENFIPTATDELDAIVEATAAATGTIMDACEVIEDGATQIGGDYGPAFTAEVTKIYEACSFQDITGQRITKVVNTLKKIEEKVGALMGIVWTAVPQSEVSGPPKETAVSDEDLLNGPQLPGSGISQDEIDKLLEEFD